MVISIKVKHFMQESLMAEMYGRLILKQKQLIETLQQHTQQLVIQPSSSLLHVPVSLDDETLDESIAEGLSFATEKLDELDALRRLFNDNDLSKYEHYKARYERFQSQSFKNLEYDFESVPTHRKSPFAKRKQLQNQRLNLPDLPTTTIGSFPQTREVRKFRADWKNNRITDAEYQEFYKMKSLVGLKSKKILV